MPRKRRPQTPNPSPRVVQSHYTEIPDRADWRHRGRYIAKHCVTPEEADQALADPERVVLDPDPSSRTGRSVRVIGWSISAIGLITVIVLPDGPTTWGVNAWWSNSTDQRRYREGK